MRYEDEIVFNTNPNEIYDMLMNSKKHTEFTGKTAKISQEVGKEFSAFDGQIVGFNVHLWPGHEIVQKWKAAEWKGYSTVNFKLEPYKGDTKLVFVHDGIPKEDFEMIKKGWKENYWAKMKKYLAKNRERGTNYFDELSEGVV